MMARKPKPGAVRKPVLSSYDKARLKARVIAKGLPKRKAPTKVKKAKAKKQIRQPAVVAAKVIGRTDAPIEAGSPVMLDVARGVVSAAPKQVSPRRQWSPPVVWSQHAFKPIDVLIRPAANFQTVVEAVYRHEAQAALVAARLREGTWPAPKAPWSDDQRAVLHTLARAAKALEWALHEQRGAQDTPMYKALSDRYVECVETLKTYNLGPEA